MELGTMGGAFIVAHVLSVTDVHGDGTLVEDRRASLQLRVGRPLVGGYVDNFMVLAATREDALERHEAICRAFNELGLAIHELRPSTTAEAFDYLGLDFTNG